MRRENFFHVLDLEESVNDWQTIERRIQEKRRDWSKDRTNGSPKAQRHADRCLRLIPEMEAVLREPETRRQEAREARKLRQKARQEKLRELDEQIEILRHGDGTFDEKRFKKLERTFQGAVTAQALRKRLRSAGLRPADEKSETPQPAREQIDPVTAKNIRKNLDDLGLASLYEFLKLSPTSSLRALTDEADEILKEGHRVGRTDADTTARNELAGQCKELFQNDRGKDRYDNYLAVEAMDGLKGSIELAGDDKFITRQEMVGLIKQAGKRGVKADDARRYIEEVARKRKWGVQRDDESAVEELRLCGFCSAPASSGARKCGECGEALALECPSCGVSNPTQNAACESCGFNVGDAPLVKGLVKQGEHLAVAGKLAEALRAFDKALLYWPGHGPAIAAKEQVRNRKEAHEAELESLDKLLRERRLTAARTALERFERQHASKGPEAAWKRIRSGLADAEAAFRKGEELRRGGRRDEALDAYDEALAACADFEPACAAVAASPPPPPAGLRVETLAGGFRLRWTAAHTGRSVTYRVVRKAQGAPQGAEDGERIRELAACTLDDVDVPVGEASYYAVFSLRSGVPSSTAATGGPHLRTAEVEDLRAVAGNGEVTLCWTAPRGCRRVAVWRRLDVTPEADGDATALTVAGATAHDTGLDNGRRYGYRVLAFFPDPARPGGEVASAGEVVFATPVAPPPAVTDLAAERQGRTVLLSWTPVAGATVQLRRGSRPPVCDPGQVLSVDELDRFGDPVAGSSPGSAQLTLRDQGRIFFVAFSVVASTAVAGHVVEVTQLDPVTDLRSRRVGAGLFLTWNWPSGLDQATVCYAPDRYPDDARQAHGTQITVTRHEYDRHGGMHLRRVEPVPHYISVFARTGDLYAASARVLEGMGQTLTVSYQVVVKKTLLRRTVEDAWLELVCREAQNGFTLPDVMVVGKTRRVPLSPRDGELVTQAASLRFEDGRSRIPIPPQHRRSNLYLKLFFQDGAQAREVRLLPAEKERLRVG